MYPLDGRLQLRDRLVYLVVHDGQVEKVAVRLLQRVRLFRQSCQAPVALEHFVKMFVVFHVTRVSLYIDGKLIILIKIRGDTEEDIKNILLFIIIIVLVVLLYIILVIKCHYNIILML